MIRSQIVIAFAMAATLLSTNVAAQTQTDLDDIAKTCGLPPDRLTSKNDRILLFASPDDSFAVMGCVRAGLDKIPGASGKLGIVMWDKKRARTK